MNCHGNATFSYEMHTGYTVDLANTTLVNSIINESICVDCHDPVPSFADHNDEDRDELLLEPHAKFVSGHGNVSCFVCHGHQPAELTLDEGADCVGCHMSTSINVTLINNSIPKNSMTAIVDNSSTNLIVTSPQVLGHGNTDCSECHGHSNSELTYTGSSEADCLACHEDNSTISRLTAGEEPVSNGTVKLNLDTNTNMWNVTPPQVLGHGNVTCIECHTHAPSDFEDTNSFLGSDCMACHEDPLRNVTLINDSIPKNNKSVVVDNTSSHWIVTSPQVVGHGNTSCAECHGHSNSDLTFVGSTDSSCMDCHENSAAEVELLLDSDPASTLTVIVNSTSNPKVVTPPQVDGHGNVSCASCHEHSPSDYSNNTAYSQIGGNCSSCHKDVNRTTYLINGTIPKNADTNWTNSPNASPAIVVGPQIFGHSRTNEVECTICHGHTNSILSSPGACNECHNN
ncbi:MAG: hypothetical protein KAJ55_16125, partial [Anaerolineales bacterium]|nr:hypothetical protein [Anaerolineales bacterium]